MHALIECSHAKMFWAAARETLVLKLPRLHPDTWTKDILCEPSFTSNEKAMITTVMYSIWTSRNNITHGEAGYNPTNTMESIKETLQTLELSTKQTLGKHRRQSCKWRKQPEHTVKINSDGAVRRDEGRAAVGIVARDCIGFLAASARVYEGIVDPLVI